MPFSQASQKQTLDRALSWYALGVMVVVTLFAFLDRMIIPLQAEIIRKAFNLSDLQLGFVQGTAIAIFAAVAAYPVGWLADRFDRRMILAGCVVFWSVAVLGAGAARSYNHLVVTYSMVGAGEAGLLPIAYAMIPQLFSAKRRQLANSIFMLAYTITASVALVICGQIIGLAGTVRPSLPAALQTMEAWRLAFFAVALPAPLMLILIATIRLPRSNQPLTPTPETLSLPEDNAHAAPAASAQGPAIAMPLIPYLKRHQTTLFFFLAATILTGFGASALYSWMAVIFLRQFGMTPQQVGASIGVIQAVGTIVGFVLSIYATRYFTARTGSKANLRILSVTLIIAAVCFVAMVFASNIKAMYVILAIYIPLTTTAGMVSPTVMQSLAPNHLRARLAALAAVLGAVAAAAAPSVAGLVSDQFKSLPNGLMLACVLVAAPSLLIAALLFRLCERTYPRTVEAVREMDETAEPMTAAV